MVVPEYQRETPPWQGSQAGLYWHPRDSAGQGERGPGGGGGCRSPLPSPRRPGTGGCRQPSAGRPKATPPPPPAVSAVGSAAELGSGPGDRTLTRGFRRFVASGCGQPGGNLISAVAFGEKSGRRPRPASGEQTKVCEERPRGRATAGRPC